MELHELEAEMNAILKEGFESVDQSWRERSRIESVANFRPAIGIPTLETYSRMAVLTEADIASGGYRAIVRELGVGSGQKFLEVFADRAGSGRAVVSFLNGIEHPSPDLFKNDDGSFEVRCYFDFGITPQSPDGIHQALMSGGQYSGAR